MLLPRGEVDVSDVGEPSTVSQPLSWPSSSDMLVRDRREMSVSLRGTLLLRYLNVRVGSNLLGLLHGETEGLD